MKFVSCMFSFFMYILEGVEYEVGIIIKKLISCVFIKYG